MLGSTWHSRSTRGVVVACASAALVLAGCSGKDTGDAVDLSIQPVMQVDQDGKEIPFAEGTLAASPAGDGGANCPPGTTIAMAGALTGKNSALGINIVNGAKLAIEQHNEANSGCQIVLRTWDTEGDEQKATQVIPQIVGDESVVGMVGPFFSGETEATGKILSDAGLVTMTPSATKVELTQKGWTSFFRGLPHDKVQGGAVANYMINTAGYEKVCVVKLDDAYGEGLAQAINEGLGGVADPGCAASVKNDDNKDYSAVVTKVTSAKPDAVFFAGFYAQSAPLIEQLKSGGFEGDFVSGDGSNDPEFVKQAGTSAEGATLSCPCGPAPAEFASAYQELTGQAPGIYSVEAYDLATILAKGIGAGKLTRPDLLDFVRAYDGAGLGRNYSWDASGELSDALIWVYEVE
ncbi:branched-chain amino acid ABC transporter substrate-binding protein [Nocardia sp. CNY236]|uniref:branched-chain amino acid ABC transporter substrate-binding protein n=1 Tax=Nocardia sp. CNY236 TaxID=1169152 RepID=UPI0003FC45CF|nr:branched-chain amino acid ABC transporter substrate-binding protein [Nocardia sp. CNY236]